MATAVTDAGMLCVWCPEYFRDVDGYDAWETRVNERLGDAISAGELVPVNIQSDGAFGIRVAIAPPDLTEREHTYAVVTSEPYLLAVTGGELCLSGIEGVGDADRAPFRVTLVDGRYAVRANDRGLGRGTRWPRARWQPHGGCTAGLRSADHPRGRHGAIPHSRGHIRSSRVTDHAAIRAAAPKGSTGADAG